MLRMLNLGCGKRFHADWINVDFCSCAPEVQACDLSGGLPFPDADFDVVHHLSHRSSLARALEEAGFVHPRPCRADESAIPGFNAYLLDIEPDGSTRKPDSLFMEAVKP